VVATGTSYYNISNAELVVTYSLNLYKIYIANAVRQFMEGI